MFRDTGSPVRSERAVTEFVRLLARQPERETPIALTCAQARFLPDDVVARDRHHALLSGQLNLEHHHTVLAKRHFRAGEIELPHPAEPVVVEPLDLLAMRQESLPPDAPGLTV